MSNITNLDVAVLSKFNQLAERYGLNPTDFIASVHPGDRSGVALVIEDAPHDEKGLAKAKQMLAPLGISMPDDGNWVLQAGEARDIYNALAGAVDKAPRTRGR